MSQIITLGNTIEHPQLNRSAASNHTVVTLNAAGETCHMVGYVMLENPLSGSKTISSAGGGSIIWRSGAVTFANGSTTFDVGLQDVSTAASPSQGDGTFDVKASFTGGGGGVTGSATQTSVMTTGTKTIAQGDLIAITLAMTAAGGADSVIVQCNTTSPSLVAGAGAQLPVVCSNVSGSYAKTTSALPNAYILFDDGTVGYVYGCGYSSLVNAAQTYNSTTGTADEYGNLLNYPHTFYATGISALISFAGNSSDCELLLYSAPLGTPAAQRTITIDATQLSVTGSSARIQALFSSPYLVYANTDIGITIRPTTANNLSTYYSETNSSVGGKTAYPNANCYAIRRLDNSGAFSDYNGGTAKTRLMYLCLNGIYMEQGVNNANYRIGI